MKKRVGLRTEILVYISLLMAAALLFVSFILLKLFERELLEERLSHVVELVDVLSAGLAGDLATGKAPSMLSASSASRGLSAWAIYDSQLQLLYARESEQSFAPGRGTLSQVRLSRERKVDVHYDGAWWPFDGSGRRYVDLLAPIQEQGRFFGILQARFSLEDIRIDVLVAQRFVLALIVLYGLVLVLFGVYLLGRNVVRPVKILSLATQRVASGNLDEEIPIRGPLEIAGLAASFNAMISALKESRQVTDATIESLRRANDKIRQSQDELIRSERMASVGHLAAGMAHEIGNPLGAVVGYVEILKQEISDPSSGEILERVSVEVERIDRLVRDLLDYAGPGDGKTEQVDPSEALREASSLLEHQGAFDHHLLEKAIPEHLPSVRISVHKLIQVFVNLIVNARDATAEGKLIRLAGGTQDHLVWLTVQDQGHGIPGESLGHLFDPFYSTKAPDKGRGLGLAVCHRIINEAGGHIDVVSEVDRGTTFTVWLPENREGV